MILLTELNTSKINHSHEIFVYLFIIQAVITILVVIAFFIHIKKRNNIEKKYITNINNLTTNHIEQIEKIRISSNKREEERSRQWFESEKETLKVLGGVSKLLDLNEKITKLESNKTMLKIDELINELKKLKKKILTINNIEDGET